MSRGNSPCVSGKVRYRDEMEAWFALARCQVERKVSTKRQEERLYRCGHCEGFHLTSQKGPNSKGFDTP